MGEIIQNLDAFIRAYPYGVVAFALIMCAVGWLVLAMYANLRYNRAVRKNKAEFEQRRKEMFRR
jgi:hypothetical protein